MVIAHAAGYIDQSDSTLSEFAAMYQEYEPSQEIWLHDSRTWTHQYNMRLEKTWDIALKELPQNARSFLNILVMFSPDDMLESMLFDAESTGSFAAYDRTSNLRERSVTDVGVDQRNL